MKYSLFILIFLILLPIKAKEAIVIPLRLPDIEQAKYLISQEKAFKIKIINEYLEADMSQKGGCVLEGIVINKKWGCGEFIFTNDSKYIIPSTTVQTRFSEDALYTIKNGEYVEIKEKSEWEIEQEQKGSNPWIYNNDIKNPN